MSGRWRVVAQCYHIPRILNILRRPIQFNSNFREKWRVVKRICMLDRKEDNNKTPKINAFKKKRSSHVERNLLLHFFWGGRNNVSASKHGSARASVFSKFPCKCDRQDLKPDLSRGRSCECTFLTFFCLTSRWLFDKEWCLLYILLNVWSCIALGYTTYVYFPTGSSFCIQLISNDNALGKEL